ncbi:Lactosylceramide 1,3-N-acetyl-beta-D-glucosaminyltransferase A [Echinococcus granulosus]|nr:Lactosylceramide 1,3-N-acetyl-beta-D-glucosaminyltransferase A [Echinococcus granulosus]
MLATLRVAAKLLCLLAICLLLGYTWNDFRLTIFRTLITPLHTSPFYCRWPPATPDEIRTENNTYNFTLCIRLHSDASANDSITTYPIQSLFNVEANGTWVSFKTIGECPRSVWKQAIYPNVYRTYPQDVPIQIVAEAIKSGSPVSVTPNYNFPIHIRNTSKSVCSNGTKYDLVVVVKSGILAWERRRLFRAFMQHQKDLNPNTKLGIVFSLGIPRQHGGRIFNRDGHTTVLEGPFGDLMDAYNGRGGEVMQNIEREMRRYDDIVLADYEDTYFNLTWKTVTNLRWISAFCDKVHNDVFMIIDDDHRMDVAMLMKFLASIPRDKKRTSIFGRIANGDGANRSPLRKLYLSFREIPWDVMCAYPRGFSQLIGADIVDDMAIGSAYTRYNYVHEDVYLGLLAFKLGIPLHHVNTMFDHGEYKFRSSQNSDVMVAHSSYWDNT